MLKITETGENVILEIKEIFAFDLLTRPDPPSSPELLLPYLVATEACYNYHRFFEETERKNRVVKHKHMLVYFDATRLRKNDLAFLEAFVGLTYGSRLCWVENETVVLDIYHERGLAFHTLHALMLYRDIASAIDRIYRRAGLMVELSFSVIDCEWFHHLLLAVLEYYVERHRSVIVSMFANSSATYKVIRTTRKRTLEKYGGKTVTYEVLWYPEISRPLTLKEAMEFRDEVAEENREIVREVRPRKRLAIYVAEW